MEVNTYILFLSVFIVVLDMLLTMKAEKSAYTLSTSFKRKKFLNELQKSDNLTKHAVKQALLKCLRDFLTNAKEKKCSHAHEQEIRKTDVALTSHSLELCCQFWYFSAAVGNGQVGSQCLVASGQVLLWITEWVRLGSSTMCHLVQPPCSHLIEMFCKISGLSKLPHFPA